MKEIPNPWVSLTSSFYKPEVTKTTMSMKKTAIHKIIQEKISRLIPKSSNQQSPIENIQSAPAVHTNSSKQSPISLSWARHQDEVREAQRLRYKVFAEEMGATLKPSQEGLDIDIFDDFCEHLIIRDTETLRVIGTYRVLPPHQAKQMGCFYSDSEFDLTRLRHLRHKMVEVGRSCVHRDYRSGGVIMALWSGLGQYMKKHDYEIMLGCASVQMGDGGHYAASLSKMLNSNHLTDIEYRVFPRLALPVDELNNQLDVEPPALIKGYLRLGAKVCGDPAWDPDFNTADFLTMLRMDDIHPRYAKHFLGQ
jgi:putative hemolysin